MTDAPIEHIQDGMELTSDREVQLWEITLRDGSKAFLRNGPTITWRDNEYENLPIMLTGEETTSDDKTNRPSLRIFNPKKIFGPMAHEGKFELATIIRRTVLQENLLANRNVFTLKIWLVGQISSCTSRVLQVSLRSPTDGPNMNVPYRFYAPPDFPTVSL